VGLVDSDVVIDYLRGQADAVALLRELDDRGEQLAASEIVRFEVLAGMQPGEDAAIEELFLALEWIPVVEAVTRRAASLARQYRAVNVGVEDADYLIAATAVELEVPLVTRNVRHYPMLPGLEPPY
jgi:predicted nucleic acid-binding protein